MNPISHSTSHPTFNSSTESAEFLFHSSDSQFNTLPNSKSDALKNISPTENPTAKLNKALDAYSHLKTLTQTCAICLNDVKLLGPDTSILDCWHIYHPSCIEEWETRSSQCPTCKQHNFGRSWNIEQSLQTIQETGDLIQSISNKLSDQQYTQALNSLQRYENNLQEELNELDDLDNIDKYDDLDCLDSPSMLPSFIREDEQASELFKLITPSNRVELLNQLKLTLLLHLLQQSKAPATLVNTASHLLKHTCAHTVHSLANKDRYALDIPKLALQLLSLSNSETLTTDRVYEANLYELRYQFDAYLKTEPKTSTEAQPDAQLITLHDPHNPPSQTTAEPEPNKLSNESIQLIDFALNDLLNSARHELNGVALELYDAEDLSAYPFLLEKAHNQLTELVFNHRLPLNLSPKTDTLSSIEKALFTLSIKAIINSLLGAFDNSTNAVHSLHVKKGNLKIFSRYLTAELAHSLPATKAKLTLLSGYLNDAKNGSTSLTSANNPQVNNPDPASERDSKFDSTSRDFYNDALQCINSLSQFIYDASLPDIQLRPLSPTDIDLLKQLDKAVESTKTSFAKNYNTIEVAKLRKKFFQQIILLNKMGTNIEPNTLSFNRSLQLTHRKLLHALQAIGASPRLITDFTSMSFDLYPVLKHKTEV